jgi:Tfp pilus assembly protein PilO
MIKESTKRLAVSMGSLVLIALSLYVYSSLISPQLSELQELRGKRQATLAALSDYETAIQEKNRVISRYQSVEPLQSVFDEVVPPDQSIPSLLNQLYGLAKLNNIFVDSVEFQEMPLQTTTSRSLVKPYGTIQANIKCASDYESMKAYLAAIETNVRLMNVRTVTVTEGFGDNPTLSYTIAVEAYYITD